MAYNYGAGLKDFSPVDACRMKYDRDLMFKDLRAHVKSTFSGMKLYYGFLNENLDANGVIQMLSCINTSFDKNSRKIDYAFAYQFTTPKLRGEQIWMEAPLFFSPKSLGSLAYYKYRHREKEFYNDYFNSAIIFPKKLFEDFINGYEGLTINQYGIEHDQFHRTHQIELGSYWKNPSNSDTVLEAMSELASMYDPRNRRL